VCITAEPGSALQSNGSMVCMIGGVGRAPSNIARTKSMPTIDARTSFVVTPYSTFRAAVSSIMIAFPQPG
jgi:hypothetical protein